MAALTIDVSLRRQRRWPVFMRLVLSVIVLAAALPAQATNDLTLSEMLKSKEALAHPAVPAKPAVPIPDTVAGPNLGPGGEPVITLGIGDTVTMEVYGKPELKTTTYIADDGTVLVPLAGLVMIGGLSPSDAANKIGKALKDGEFLVNPQVSVAVVTSRSQQVSVLGEVGKSGRYTVESGSTVFDLLAQAGGKTETGASEIFLLRPDGNGGVTRTALNLDILADPSAEFPNIRFKGGDTLFVPKAGKFYIQGEVVTPNQYKLEPNMTVTEAIARAGGITRRGSAGRVDIKRRNPDGTYATIHPKPTDRVLNDDVIRVKESIF